MSKTNAIPTPEELAKMPLEHRFRLSTEVATLALKKANDELQIHRAAQKRAQAMAPQAIAALESLGFCDNVTPEKKIVKLAADKRAAAETRIMDNSVALSVIVKLAAMLQQRPQPAAVAKLGDGDGGVKTASDQHHGVHGERTDKLSEADIKFLNHFGVNPVG